jgi:hypothetical protein
MTHRYCGDTSRAIDEYRNTLTLIEKERLKFQASSDLGRQYLTNLRERAANTRERLADCTLYGGAASGVGLGQLTEAAKLYAEAAELYDDDAMKRVMRTKQALILFLLDDIEKGEAILAKLDEEKHDLLGNQIRTEMIHQLTDTIHIFQKSRREGKVDEGRKALRSLLNKMDFTDSGVESTRRENLEMRLFATEFLFNDDLQDNELAEADRDVTFLAAPFPIFWNRPETRPFIRRVADQRVRYAALAYEKDHAQRRLDATVRFLQHMRSQGRPDETQSDEPSTLIVFFLTEMADDGFAIFYPQDGRLGELYRVPFTRQQVKNASQKNKKDFVLDERLCKAIKDEKAAGRKIVLSWSDAASWARTDDALSDADWPFNFSP